METIVNLKSYISKGKLSKRYISKEKLSKRYIPLGISLLEYIPWYVKVAILVLGLFYHPLGVLLLLIDGYFHFTSNQTQLEETSPDWIVAKHFGGKGLPENLHKLMGIVLLATSLAFIYYAFIRSENPQPFYDIYTKIMYPLFLIMITMAIVLKHNNNCDNI